MDTDFSSNTDSKCADSLSTRDVVTWLTRFVNKEAVYGERNIVDQLVSLTKYRRQMIDKSEYHVVLKHKGTMNCVKMT